MVESDVAAAPTATPKKAKSAKPKKPKTAAAHPKVSEMVNAAISTLKERGGSSLQAIKKYIGAHYKVDVDKMSPFIKNYLKKSVVSGALTQTKGKGASGSFRMPTSGKEKTKSTKVAKAKTAKPAAKKAAKPKTPKISAVKKLDPNRRIFKIVDKGIKAVNKGNKAVNKGNKKQKVSPGNRVSYKYKLKKK